MFSISSHWRGRLSSMADPAANLKPAPTSEVADALSRSLLVDGRRRVHDADLIIGRVTAATLVEHLRGAGFMIVKTERGVAAGHSHG